jgi:hypothetical protein
VNVVIRNLGQVGPSKEKEARQEQMFADCEFGTVITFNIAEEHHHIRGTMIVREKDSQDMTVTGVILTRENIECLFDCRTPWSMTIDATDIEMVIPKYYSKHQS